MRLQEVIFCATASPATGSGSGAIALHDISTGTTLASFKQTNATPHCTALITSRDAQGGFFLAAQPDKSLLHVYNFQKDQISLKIVLPEKLCCVALDPRGEFFAGGTVNGRIYLWEVSSGILYNSWDAHYRQVTVLRFTQDGAVLLSGSDDSGVSVWSVSRLLDEDLQNDLPLPYFTLTDHTLPITDMICGVGTFPECRVLTSSIDNSVKLWDLSSRSLLTTFMFPQAITSLAWDQTERMFFAASSDGSIYQTNLFRQRETKSGGTIAEAIGGAGASDVIRLTEDTPDVQKKRLIIAGQPITCLAISLTSSLLVGTSTGLIQIYDIPTHQLLRTISAHKGFTISYLTTILKPVDLTGHVTVSLSMSATSVETIPVKPVAPFQRMRDIKTRDMHEVSMLLPSQDEDFEDETTLYSKESLLRDHSNFVRPSSSGHPTQDATSLQSRVTDLEGEVARLREQLGQAKGVNNLMWETVVHKVVAQEKTKGESVELPAGHEENGNKKRKRTRP